MADQKKKQVHSGHRERMRQRFAADGLSNYRPHEVIEQVLFDVIRRANTNPLGHHLIDTFGSVIDVLNASYDELIAVDGVGVKTAEYIVSLRETLSGLIYDSLRGRGPITEYNIAFLGDWFYRLRDENNVILVSCTESREFIECIRIYDPAKDGDFDPFNIGLECVKRKNVKYYFLMARDNAVILRDDVLRLREVTLHMKSYMLDAYYFKEYKPISYLYKAK